MQNTYQTDLITDVILGIVVLAGVVFALAAMTVPVVQFDAAIQEVRDHQEWLQSAAQDRTVIKEPEPHLDVEEKIRAIAAMNDFDADTLVNLATCESDLAPAAVGGERGCFHGLYQWNTCFVRITEECAHDVACSTIRTIVALERGEKSRWPNCP